MCSSPLRYRAIRCLDDRVLEPDSETHLHIPKRSKLKIQHTATFQTRRNTLQQIKFPEHISTVTGFLKEPVTCNRLFWEACSGKSLLHSNRETRRNTHPNWEKNLNYRSFPKSPSAIFGTGNLQKKLQAAKTRSVGYPGIRWPANMLLNTPAKSTLLWQ